MGAFIVVPVSNNDETSTELDYKMLSSTDDRDFERRGGNGSRLGESKKNNDEMTDGNNSPEATEPVGEDFTHFDKDYVALLQVCCRLYTTYF